jgi:hypothetical protein
MSIDAGDAAAIGGRVGEECGFGASVFGSKLSSSSSIARGMKSAAMVGRSE